MRNCYFFLFLMAILLSCSEKFPEKILQEEPIHCNNRSSKKGIVRFNTTHDLSTVINLMKEESIIDIFDIQLTKVESDVNVDSNFISLRQHLKDQGLREFTDAELAEIIADSLVYEPEDSLIVDPYMAAVLNNEREIQIEDKIYRFVDEGLIIYDATDSVLFDPREIQTPIVSGELAHGQAITIRDNNNNSAEFVKVSYASTTMIDDEQTLIDNGSGDIISGGEYYGDNGSTDTSDVYKKNYDMQLADYTNIPNDKIRRAIYKKGGGSGSWLANTVSDLFGLNVTIINNYDVRHRMKLRMYEQDYIIYRACGMTVRMQKRTFGIWWRKKAQEFRYGWSAIECEYEFPEPQFLEPPKMPDGTVCNKYPTSIIKKFPYADTDGVLFYIPYIDYDVTTGDINKVVALAIKKIAKTIDEWLESPINNEYVNNPRGLFSTRNNDEKIIVIYPQGEEVAYNDGRESIKWDKQWFSGNFTLGFGYNLNGSNFNVKEVSFSPAKNVSIKRGQVYAAVRYNNEWRACIIETE